jgi:DNA-binding transcriptional LysR family regulator
MNKLEKIETFIVLAECRSFTEAARRLYCSQPTISHHIQQLEQHFDTLLFHRSGKTIQLTEQGEILLQYAKKINSLIEEASVKMKKATREEHTLPIYVSNYIAGYYFSDILRQFHNISSRKFLEINAYSYDDLKRSLREGKTNFALMPIYPEDDYICNHCETYVLFEEELPLILPVGHPWTHRRVLYCRDLQNETILLPQSHYLQQYITDQLNRRQIKARFLQMSNFEIIKKAVKSQHGIAFLPYGAVEGDIKKGELLSRPVSTFRISRKNGFVVRKNIQLSQDEKVFCKNAEQYLKSV